jgi:hypothetical protein
VWEGRKDSLTFVTVLRMKTELSRPLCIATAIVFLVSALFPLGAGLAKDTSSFPLWWGAADVGIAFVLAALTLAVLAIGTPRVTKQVEETTYRAYRVLIHGILVLMVVFVFAGDRIAWSHGLSGLAWRSWLLLYALPVWLAAYGA